MTSYANADFYRALFDDDFSNPNGTFTVSHPGEGFEQHITAFTQAVPGLTNPSASDAQVSVHSVKFPGIQIIAPDDLWVQCGIQFRLASVTRLNVRDPGIQRVDMSSTAMNTAVSSLKNRSLGFDSLPGDSVEPLYGINNGEGLYVGIMTFASNNGYVGAAGGRSWDGVAGIGVADITPGRASATLAHEIGHVFGITGPDEGHPNCSDGSEAQQIDV